MIMFRFFGNHFWTKSMHKIVKTSDGSYTLINEHLNEPYHSIHGALTESMHVFIENGLYYFKPFNRKLKVLEIGFGTGLNAVLLFQETNKHIDLEISYTGLEPFPVSRAILNDIRLEGFNHQQFIHLHDTEKNKWNLLTPKFHFRLIEEKFENYNGEELFDLIFYDAFGPSSQPELWDNEILEKSVRIMEPGGVWVSYCSKGDVRRGLKEAGLIVERLPGPPFKRHVLRGIKQNG